MTREQLLGAIQRRPFRPFVVVSTSGESYAVRHPEQTMISQSGKTLAVFQGETTIILDVALVADLVVGPSKRGAKKGGE